MMPEIKVSAELVGSKGGLIDTKSLKRDIAKTNQRFAKRMKRSFEQSVGTWNHPVSFHQKTNTAEMSVSVYTIDFVYFLLDEGTSIRYLVMSEDFSPKTRPGSLESRPGSGGPAYFDFDNPRDGIAPRGFSKQVEDKHGPDYQAAIDTDLDRAVRKVK
jgi:hypothetical protein